MNRKNRRNKKNEEIISKRSLRERKPGLAGVCMFVILLILGFIAAIPFSRLIGS